MRIKRVNRYYCDFCGKGGCSAYHMTRHEKRCTLNPLRKCGMCAVSDDPHNHSLDELRAILRTAKIIATEEGGILGTMKWISLSIENEEEVLKALENASNGCPTCMLAAIRQSEHPVVFQSFDFKARQKDFWEAVNERESSHYDGY